MFFISTDFLACAMGYLGNKRAMHAIIYAQQKQNKVAKDYSRWFFQSIHYNHLVLSFLSLNTSTYFLFFR